MLEREGERGSEREGEKERGDREKKGNTERERGRYYPSLRSTTGHTSVGVGERKREREREIERGKHRKGGTGRKRSKQVISVFVKAFIRP